MTGLALNGLTKVFNGVGAVNDLNLRIDNGDFFVLLGPSGCGKTTTLRMIAGLEKATGGDIILNGKRINDIPPKDRDMAMVFQDYALYPHMTVFDNIGFGLKMRKVGKQDIHKRVMQAAELLNITPLLKRKPHSLSGGERQRVALGRAIVRQPKIFLFDEPLSNLDATLREQMRNEIIKLHRELNITFIYVTHDQVEAMTMASRIAILDKGVLQQYDTPEKVYRKPLNSFVAGFIGNPKMNMMECILETRQGELYLYLGVNELLIPQELKERFFEKRLIGKPLTIGIRPEHILISGKKNKNCLLTNISYIENTGANVYLHLHLPGYDHHNIVARTDTEQSYFGSKAININFKWDNILLFNSDGCLIQY